MRETPYEFNRLDRLIERKKELEALQERSWLLMDSLRILKCQVEIDKIMDGIKWQK